MSTRIELTGKTFGAWFVLEYAGDGKWLCRCVCGKERKVAGHSLRSGISTNCRCLVKGNLRHGRHGTKAYNAWKALRQRCTNKNGDHWENYGGRGISVCDRWESFENFYLDMGDPASEDLSIERKDVNLGYSPDNCIWADANTQAVNTTKRKDNTSGYVGVFKNGSGWGAKLNWKREIHHIGTFRTKEEAAKARNDYIVKNNLPHKLNSIEIIK